MKYALVFLSVLGLSFACDLAPAWDAILSNVDLDGAKAWLLDSFENDPDGQRVLAYLQGEDATVILDAVWEEQAVKDLVNWIADSNVDIYGIINGILSALGRPTISPVALKHKAIHPRDLASWFDQLGQFIDGQGIVNTLIDLLGSDPCAGELLERLSSPEINAVVQKVRALPELQDLVATLEAEGIDVQGIWNQICAILNWCE